jgi:hypothetical protein
MSGNQKQQQTGHQNQATVKTKKSEPKAIRNIDPLQMISAPETLRSEDVLAAQQQVGNQVVQRALDKKGRDQRVTDGQGNLNEDINKQIQAKRGGGSPLPESIQQDASKKLGRKFNDVRIHTDETADKLSRTVSARAFTIGKDIFFKGGVFSPTSSAGRETLIHELTHVVQQSGSKTSSGGKLKLGAPDTAMEKEAAHLGKKHATQQSAALPAAGSVQRIEEEELLQGQPDVNAAIQRVEEEELLQGQPDPSVAIQRQGMEEEEMLQGQPDPSVAIQREGEEEEMQMQPDPAVAIQREGEEEEMQMQPDTGVVQRQTGTMEEELKNLRGKGIVSNNLKRNSTTAEKGSPTRSRSNTIGSIQESGMTRKSAVTSTPTSSTQVSDPNITTPDKTAKSPSNSKALDVLGIKKGQETKEPAKDPKKEQALNKEVSRNKLKEIIANPSKSSDDVSAAKEKLDTLHKRSIKDNALNIFKKSYSKEASKDRKKELTRQKRDAKARAAAGDEGAYEEYKQKKAQKAKEFPGMGSKIGGFFKKAANSKLGGLLKKGAGMVASKLGGVVKGQIDNAKEHYMGKKEEEKKEEAKPAGGGGGGGGMAATISELYQENKQLKTENAELKKKKEEVPVS